MSKWSFNIQRLKVPFNYWETVDTASDVRSAYGKYRMHFPKGNGRIIRDDGRVIISGVLADEDSLDLWDHLRDEEK